MTLLERLGNALPMPHVSLHARVLAVVGFFLASYAGASAVASYGDRMLVAPALDGTQVSAPLTLPALGEQADRLARQSAAYTYEMQTRSGLSLGALFEELRIDDPRAQAFVRSNPLARRLLQVRNGTQVLAAVDANGQLSWLQFPIAAAHSASDDAADASAVVVRIERGDDGFRAAEEHPAYERRVEMHVGVIASSLYAATDDAGIPDAVTRQVADIFDADINFHADLRKGDTFRVAYEAFYRDGEFVRAGRVLATEFVNAGVAHRAVWYRHPPDRGAYYTPDGHNVHKAFLRLPIAFSRVSSGFSDNRMHPIHQRWEKHTGVDYAAPTGTPIRAVGDGSIEFAGWKNGYGKVVIVRHSGIYETLYAHMSRFDERARVGARIAQGQIIGYVGMTGWATGPHLHYEFHVAGQARDPMRVALPDAAPLAPELRADFAAYQSDMLERIALLRPTQLAQR